MDFTRLGFFKILNGRQNCYAYPKINIFYFIPTISLRLKQKKNGKEILTVEKQNFSSNILFFTYTNEDCFVLNCEFFTPIWE
jgi:hypothetical protein